MPAQHIFAAGRWLGSREVPRNRVVPGLEIRPQYSTALYCMRCGEIWGRFAIDGASLTQLTIKPCLKHGDGRLSSTYANRGEPDNFGPDWPAAALEWELQAELALLSSGDTSASPGVKFE